MFVRKGDLRYCKNMDEILDIEPPVEEIFRLGWDPCLTLPPTSETMEELTQPVCLSHVSETWASAQDTLGPIRFMTFEPRVYTS